MDGRMYSDSDRTATLISVIRYFFTNCFVTEWFGYPNQAADNRQM